MRSGQQPLRGDECAGAPRAARVSVAQSDLPREAVGPDLISADDAAAAWANGGLAAAEDLRRARTRWQRRVDGRCIKEGTNNCISVEHERDRPTQSCRGAAGDELVVRDHGSNGGRRVASQVTVVMPAGFVGGIEIDRATVPHADANTVLPSVETWHVVATHQVTVDKVLCKLRRSREIRTAMAGPNAHLRPWLPIGAEWRQESGRCYLLQMALWKASDSFENKHW
jgi:hypothetical protein